MKVIDWNNISKSRIEKINKSKSIFILAPIDISEKKIISLTKKLNKNGSVNILWGIIKDKYIQGCEGAPQFESLKLSKLERVLTRNNAEAKIITYYARDINYLVEALRFKAVIMMNGSWYRTLHTNEFYWKINRLNIPYKIISPFTDSKEAVKYVEIKKTQVDRLVSYSQEEFYTDKQVFSILDKVSLQSYATDWRTSAILAKKSQEGYKLISHSHNVVVPYETYALHNGSLKEKHFSPPNDLNHFDTNHAEMELILNAMKARLSLKNKTIFINLLPCPTCSRMLLRTGLKEIVYTHDHSSGYAYRLLTENGKIVRRFIY